MHFVMKSSFGKIRCYPKDVEAIAICKVSKQKSLTKEQIEILEGVGIVIVKDVEL